MAPVPKVPNPLQEGSGEARDGHSNGRESDKDKRNCGGPVPVELLNLVEDELGRNLAVERDVPLNEHDGTELAEAADEGHQTARSQRGQERWENDPEKDLPARCAEEGSSFFLGGIQ